MAFYHHTKLFCLKPYSTPLHCQRGRDPERQDRQAYTQTNRLADRQARVLADIGLREGKRASTQKTRQTRRQTDKQASRQIGRHTASRGRQPDRGIHTNTIEYSDRKRGSLTTRQTGRQTQSQEFRQVSSTGGRQTSIQTSGRQRQDRQTERQTDWHKETDRQSNKQTGSRQIVQSSR